MMIQLFNFSRNIQFRKKSAGRLATFATVFVSLCTQPLLAQDPFRTTNPQEIGSATEAAFKAWFEQGHFKTASTYLEQAITQEPNEPLVYAMKASLAYLEEDQAAFNTYAIQTRQVAEKLIPTNPLRGNLYTAVGHFLEGGYILANEGTVKGTPPALTKLRQAFQSLDAAEKINPQDPELNLLKGYMDLLLSVNLPFSNPDEAIQRLENYAGPSYLAQRGIALGHKNLQQYNQALTSINRVLEITPNNPEANYLKAQILVNLKDRQSAKLAFETALSQPDQLPKEMVGQIFYEYCKNQKRIENSNRNCDGMRDSIREEPGSWGPQELPKLNAQG